MEQYIDKHETPYIRPVRDLRNNFAEIKELIKNHEPVFITDNGRGTAVVINIDDYAAYEDYLYDKYVAEKLAEAEKIADKPDAVWHSAEDVARRMREGLE